MARYIDADKLCDNLKIMANVQPSFKQSAILGVVSTIENTPPANVVLKSEVDRLVDKWIGEENLTQDAMVLRLIEALRDEAKRYEKYYFNHEYDKLIAEAKQEIAREIFEEIEELINHHYYEWDFCYYDDELGEDFAELKKKYIGTEGANV